MTKNLKKYLILGFLFFFPIFVYVFLSTGINNFAKLPVLTQTVMDIENIEGNSAKVSFKNKISIVAFWGGDVNSKKSEALNLNQKIYKRFNKASDCILYTKESCQWCDKLKVVFKKYDIEYTLNKTEYAGHAVGLVKKTDLMQYDSVCAMGGDGTLFEVLNGMLTRSENERIPISIIPSGTGNSFMKTVSIENVVDAVGKISKNEPKKLDRMRVVCAENIYYSLNLIGWCMATDI